MLTTPHNKLPLGGPAWLRAIAEEKEEMNHALPSEIAEHRRLDDREVQGIRDAADRIERLEQMLVRADGALETCGVGKGAPVRVNIASAISR
jgi:hypothetical protein